MKTSIKFLVIALSASLTGCGGGGGGSGDSASAPVTPTKKEVLFDNDSTAYTFKLQPNQASQEVEAVTGEVALKEGVLYRKNLPQQQFEPYMLTDEALYVPDTAASYDASKGVRTDFLTAKTSLQWHTTQFSQNGARDLKQVINWREVALADRSIAVAVDPFTSAGISLFGLRPGLTYSGLNLPSRIYVHQPKFSEQAKCLHLNSVKNNKEYYAFWPDDAVNVIAGVNTLVAWEQQKNSLIESERPLQPLQTKLLAGYKIGWLKFNTSLNTTMNPVASIGTPVVQYAIEYQGKLIRLEPRTELLQTHDDSVNKAIAAWSSAYPLNFLTQIKQNLQDSCTFYNQAAMDDLKRAIEQAKTSEISITPFIKDVPVTPEAPVDNCWGGMTFC